jgi:hypothetical protein
MKTGNVIGLIADILGVGCIIVLLFFLDEFNFSTQKICRIVLFLAVVVSFYIRCRTLAHSGNSALQGFKVGNVFLAITFGLVFLIFILVILIFLILAFPNLNDGVLVVLAIGGVLGGILLALFAALKAKRGN